MRCAQVISRSLNPIFNERLYFPVLLYKFDAEQLGMKQQEALPPYLPPCRVCLNECT